MGLACHGSSQHPGHHALYSLRRQQAADALVRQGVHMESTHITLENKHTNKPSPATV